MKSSHFVTVTTHRVTYSHGQLVTVKSGCGCAVFRYITSKFHVKFVAFFAILHESSRKRLCGGQWRQATTTDNSGGRCEIVIKPHTNFM